MSILDQYGIKEVADLTFYDLDSNGKPTAPVLYIDTAKVSTLEFTAETADARGGKGNPKLITWDFGKEVTVTIEDALFSAKSMAIMFGNGKVTNLGSDAKIMKTEVFTATATTLPTEASSTTYTTISGWYQAFQAPDGKLYKKVNPKFYDEESASVTDALVVGNKYFCSYDLEATGAVIEVSANSFPGTYYVTGDTFARSQASGKDEFFQFIIPKAKVTSENTITLEAEGDPSVFNMNLTVLRPESGAMVQLVKYDLEDGIDGSEAEATIIHNHTLTPVTNVAGE